jgi:hypothetical protein
MRDDIEVAARFCGPDGMGNGGYSCGLLAEAMGAPAQVTLLRPIPLDRRLALAASAGHIEARDDDDAPLARASRAELALEVPPATTLHAAAAASERFLGFQLHPFPRCFVCGPERRPGDALRIFPGELAPGRVATTWVPDRALSDPSGRVRLRYLAAALDCPGAWALVAAHGPVLMVLGRLTIDERAPVIAGRPHVVEGWALARDGRKHHCGTAIRDPDGTVLALARATWIAVDRSPSA